MRNAIRLLVLSLLVLVYVCTSRVWSKRPFPTSVPQTPDPTPSGVVKVLFHSNQCGFRGTDAATFDYAFFGELFYNMESYHTFPAHAVHSQAQLSKLEATFPSRVIPLPVPDGKFWRDVPELYRTVLDAVVRDYKIDYLYKIEDGAEAELVLTTVPTLIHAVFECERPHGSRMLAVSDTVHHHGQGCSGSVPHMVWIADCRQETLRAELNIPEDAFVFGWLGGDDAWDASVTGIVKEVAALAPEVYFMFQNFPADQGVLLQNTSNVLLVEATNDAYFKCKFGRTMDVFLHPRPKGETFGLAVAEVSLRNL